MKKNIFILIILSAFSFNQDIISGYLRTNEVSFCMDECSLYYIENEFDEQFNSTSVIFRDGIDENLFLNRFVEIVVSNEEVNCVECSALQILEINLSNDCDSPVDCFADPCDLAEDCLLNTPVDCVSNYCGGCFSDFYDLDSNLVDCYNSEDDWEDGDNDFEDECRYFESEDECVEAGCNWDDEEGCYRNEDNDFSCDQLSQDECLEADFCTWEYSNNMPGGGFCIEVEDSENDNDGPPECLLDCEGIEFINPDQNPYEACDWIVSNFGPNNFFNECAEDCDNQTLTEINEYMEVCLECLSDNNCDEIFDDENEQDIDCSGFENEEECRLNDCDWQLNLEGVGECHEQDGNFDLVCEDLSDIFFGWCEMIIGVGWNGDECVWYSGCSTNDENGVDYSNALFDSIEECEMLCSDFQQGNGYLYGAVEYIWGDAIEMVSGASIQINSTNSFYVTETNEQGFYEIELPVGQYSISVEAYGESQTQDIEIMLNQELELNFQLGDWYYPNYSLLRLEQVTASAGENVSVPLILESNLDVAGVQFSVNYTGLAESYLYPVGLNSMNDCFTANYNDLDGEFIGIIFSLEGCSYSAGEINYIADLVFEVSDDVPSGSEFFLNFNNTIVSDIAGNPISSYGEGASILFGLQGDVNSDNLVNILDIVMIVNFAIYIEEPTASQFWASDINNDNLVNILDIVQVVNLILDN